MAAENGIDATIAAPTEKPNIAREYVVLAKEVFNGKDGMSIEAYVIVGTPEATNDGQARKMAGALLPEDERDAPLVAVPARYWKPKARKVKVTTSESWD